MRVVELQYQRIPPGVPRLNNDEAEQAQARALFQCPMNVWKVYQVDGTPMCLPALPHDGEPCLPWEGTQLRYRWGLPSGILLCQDGHWQLTVQYGTW